MVSFSPDCPEWLNSLDSITTNMGFWISVNSTVPVILHSHDVEFNQPVEVQLYKGWNLIGYPSTNDDVTLAEAMCGVPWDMVQFSDQSRPYNLRYMPATMRMEPGRGYWVHVSMDCVWTVNP